MHIIKCIKKLQNEFSKVFIPKVFDLTVTHEHPGPSPSFYKKNVPCIHVKANRIVFYFNQS